MLGPQATTRVCVSAQVCILIAPCVDDVPSTDVLYVARGFPGAKAYVSFHHACLTHVARATNVHATKHVPFMVDALRHNGIEVESVGADPSCNYHADGLPRWSIDETKFTVARTLRDVKVSISESTYWTPKVAALIDA